MTPGTVTLTERGEGRARVELRQIWSFPDAYQVGVFEGAMLALDIEGEVQLRVLSPCDADFEVRLEVVAITVGVASPSGGDGTIGLPDGLTAGEPRCR